MEEEDEKEKNMNNQKKKRERCRNNDVIITIYVESALSRRQKLHRRCQPKPRRPWRPPTSKSGYNRKAQLLAYTQQLRQSNSQEKPKAQRRWRVKCKVWIRRLFLHLRRRSGHNQTVSEEKTQEKLSQPHQRTNEPNRRQFRSILKELRCTWKCCKG